MRETSWDSYGTGNYEKYANRMVHDGYRPRAAADTVRLPLAAPKIALRGVETERSMAPEIPLDKQRPARFLFHDRVRDAIDESGTLNTNRYSRQPSELPGMNR